MVKLILDLDLTAIVIPRDRELLNPYHTISEAELSVPLKYGGKRLELSFRLINPDELSRLIEKACLKYDGVIILTSGAWPKKILGLLSDHLDISDEASKKFCNSAFYSSTTDYKYFLNSRYKKLERINHTAAVSKNIRLEKIIKYHPELRGAHFVFLDDNLNHIAGFKGSKHVIAVQATPHLEDKSFYNLAHAALKASRQKEKTLSSILAPEIKQAVSEKEILPFTFFGKQEGTQPTVSHEGPHLKNTENERFEIS